MRHAAVFLTLALLCTQARAVAADTRTTEVTWQELPSVVGHKKITMVLPDGAEIRGTVLDVEPAQLILDVNKTSDGQAHPKGRTAIPRASVTTVSMTQSRTFWKVIGTAAGLGLGLAIAVPVNEYAHNEGDGAPAAVAAIIAVPTAVGFLVGRSADRKTVTLRVR